MKKILAMAMAVVMALGLSACGSSNSAASSSAAGSVSGSASGSVSNGDPAFTTVTPGKLTLDHIARFDAEREAAGIHTDAVSPKLLPDYRGK